MKKSCLVITIIVIIVVGLICFMAGRKSMESEVAKYKKLIDYYFPVSEEIFSISGEITEIQDNVLSVETIMPLLKKTLKIKLNSLLLLLNYSLSQKQNNSVR